MVITDYEFGISEDKFTCEFMKRKCICKNVNSPCRTGCTNMTSFRQLTSIIEYMAISKPLNTRVPKPNTENNLLIVN